MITVADSREQLQVPVYTGGHGIDITTAGSIFAFNIGPFNTTSIDPPDVLYAFYNVNRNSGTPTVPTVTDSRGTTWTLLATNNWNSPRTAFFYAAIRDSAAAGTLTFDHGGTSHVAATLCYGGISGVSLSEGISAAFLQVGTNTASSSTSVSLGLAAPKTYYNRPFYFVVHNLTGNINFPSPMQFVQGNNWTITGAGPCAVVWQPYNAFTWQTSLSASFTSSFNWGIIGMEVRIKGSR